MMLGISKGSFRPSKLSIYLVLAVFICLIISEPVWGNDIIENTANQMRESQLWWDTLWQETFDPTDPSTNISIYSFSSVVRFIIGIGLIFWIYDYGKKMVHSRGFAHNVLVFSESILPTILIIIFLNDQGLYSRVLAYGLRDIVNSWTSGVMEQQIAGIKFKDAISEQLLLEETKNQIRQQAEKCLQMPRPAAVLPSAERPPADPNNPLTLQQDQLYSYFECLDRLTVFIEQKQEEARASEACSGGCNFFVKTMTALNNLYLLTREKEEAQKIIDSQSPEELIEGFEENYRSMTDFIGNLEKKSWMYVFSLIQWFWISFLEGSMWLLGLFAPLFVALSLIPGRQNMFYFWLIEFLTIGLAKVAYVAIIGVVAVQISAETTSVLMTQDARFFMALGCFAPGISFAVVTAGGIAAASSFRSQSVGAIATVGSLATGSAISIAYSISRYGDRRR